jgi:hypothetical protein
MNNAEGFENQMQGRDDLPETTDAYQRVQARRAQAENSNSLGDRSYCILAGTPEWEKWALSLPVDLTHQEPIQNPDGSFIPMEGIDL